jgi:hypothetical protein
MANFTITQVRQGGNNPASVDMEGTPGAFYMEYDIDATKKPVVAGVPTTIVAADTVDMLELPPYAGVVIEGAAVTVVKAGTASCTLSVTLGAAAAAGTAVTGLTAWAADAAAGTKLVKLATGSNSLINTTANGYVKLQFVAQAPGAGRYRVRVFGRILEAPAAT